MRWLTREDFSERRFLGWQVWLKQVCLYAWIAGFLSEIVATQGGALLFDTWSVAFIWPLLTILLLWLLTLVCMRLWRIPFLAALSGLQVLLPYLFLLPVGDLLFRGIGYSQQAGFANGWQALASLLSGGILPFSVPPSSVVSVWIGCLAWIAYSWWRTTSERTVQKLASALVPSYLIFPLLFLGPSFIGWLVMIREVPIWSSSPALVERAFEAAHIGGYAWQEVYARFPFAIGGEAHVSQQWLITALSFLLIFALLFRTLSQAWHWKRGEWIAFLWTPTTRRALFAVLLGVVASALLISATFIHAFTHIIALILLFICVSLLRMGHMAKDDLFEAVRGSLPAHRPLAMGKIRAADLEEWYPIWQVGGLTAAIFLGWPVFLAVLWSELTQRVPVSEEGWKTCLQRALPLAGYVLAGWMVGAEKGSFGSLAPAVAGLVVLGFFAFQLLRSSFSRRSASSMLDGNHKR